MNRWAAPAAVVLLVASAACGAPDTDIMATSSEDVGPWDVALAQVTGDALAADVCISDADAADTVGHRLLLQLRNKGYQRITLTMYAGQAEVADVRKVNWSRNEGTQVQAAGRAEQNPCTPRNAANAARQE